MSLPLLVQALRSNNGDDRPPSRLDVDAGDRAEANIELSGARDREVLERIRAGDEEAFLETYRSYYARLCDFAYVYVRERQLVEDIVSDLFLGIWHRRDTWRVTGSLRAYLFSAVRYRVLNARRDGRRHVEQLGAAVAVGDVPGMAASAAELQAGDESARILDAVWAAVAKLPERARVVMTLRWKEEMGIAEIAGVLGTTEMAVRQLHKRALAELRDKLAGLLVE